MAGAVMNKTDDVSSFGLYQIFMILYGLFSLFVGFLWVLVILVVGGIMIAAILFS